jgi:hypothetical protein
MKIKRTPSRLQKKARRGYQGHPLATVAYYGPDASRASKVAVGIFLKEGEPVSELRRWFSDSSDARWDPVINQQIAEFIASHHVKTVALNPELMGCPHEEAIDYPEGEHCPRCPFWAGRDRFSGEYIS